MVKLIVGLKGTGKTKTLIELVIKATEESKATEETTVGKDADKDKENGKDTNKDKDKDDDTDEKKSGPNVVLIIVLVVVVLAGAGVAAWFALKPKAATPEEKTEE